MPLRVGLLIEGPVTSSWVVQIVRRVASVDGARVVVAVQPGQHRPDPVDRTMDGIAWRAYLARLPTAAVPKSSDVVRRESLADILDGVPWVVADTEPVGRYAEAFSAKALEDVRAYHPDLLLRFAFGVIVGSVLQLPTYGVWSFHFGDEQEFRGGPACFWEVYEGRPCVGAILQRLTDRLDAGVVLRRGWADVDVTSYPRTWDAAHRLVLDWPADCCRDLVEGRSLPQEPSTTVAPVRRRPGNTTMLRFALRTVVRRLRRRHRRRDSS